jgi:ATP-binding cassette, subfamily A (ABC1), member 3
MLMSTHYMDEADILGDRVGIMAAGKLICLGSSTFLKKKFGVGYNFVVVKSSTEQNDKLISYMQKHLGPKVTL